MANKKELLVYMLQALLWKQHFPWNSTAKLKKEHFGMGTGGNCENLWMTRFRPPDFPSMWDTLTQVSNISSARSFLRVGLKTNHISTFITMGVTKASRNGLLLTFGGDWQSWLSRPLNWVCQVSWPVHPWRAHRSRFHSSSESEASPPVAERSERTLPETHCSLYS